jgi:bacillolysin
MRHASRVAARIAAVFLGTLVLVPGGHAAAGHPARVQAMTTREAGGWDARIQALVADGDLRPRQVRSDTLLPGRRHERFTQLYRGVRVFGGEVVRQSDDTGNAVSVFGTFYEGIDLDPRPTLSADRARDLVTTKDAPRFLVGRDPELVVLPEEGGGYSLCWRLREWTRNDLVMYFVDARDGRVRWQYSDLETQSAVGLGTGVLGDRKKVSARPSGGTFVADDVLRPPHISTYDFQGNLDRLLAIERVEDFLPGDLAKDSDNDWSDGANVDAHVYAGYTYDYYFKRFGRRGLDNANVAMINVTHPVRRNDLLRQPDDVIFTFYLNAFYAGDGVMVYGEGLPPGYTLNRQYWDYLAGGLDVVAHELTHGVTDYSSALVYEGESGALNESFSDVMATAVEFFFQPAGSGPRQADYLAAEDVVRPGGLRSLANPVAYGDPDHYSERFRGSEDNGGVHTNSGISNNAYYLAIEGGTHRLSRVTVQGVGAANRDQIEKVFYRAFTQLLPPRADFAMARAATIQAARDLQGPGSAAERAITQAWTAVGVE